MKRYTAMLFSILLFMTACAVDDAENKGGEIHFGIKEEMNEAEHVAELISFLKQIYLPELSEDNREPRSYSLSRQINEKDQRNVVKLRLDETHFRHINHNFTLEITDDLTGFDMESFDHVETFLYPSGIEVELKESKDSMKAFFEIDHLYYVIHASEWQDAELLFDDLFDTFHQHTNIHDQITDQITNHIEKNMIFPAEFPLDVSLRQVSLNEHYFSSYYELRTEENEPPPQFEYRIGMMDVDAKEIIGIKTPNAQKIELDSGRKAFGEEGQDTYFSGYYYKYIRMFEGKREFHFEVYDLAEETAVDIERLRQVIDSVVE